MKRWSGGDTSQRGAALPMVLLVLLFLTLLGSMAMNTSSVEVRLAANERNYQQAVYVAEAGLAHMRAILESVLNECNQSNIALSQPVDWTFALDEAVDCPPLAGQRPVTIVDSALGNYVYNVTLEATADDQQVVVRSVATSPDSGRAEVEMLLAADASSNQVSDYSGQYGGGAGKNFVGKDRNAVGLNISEDVVTGKKGEASEILLGN